MLYFAGWKERYSLYPPTTLSSRNSGTCGLRAFKGTIRTHFRTCAGKPDPTHREISVEQLTSRERKGRTQEGREAQLERIRRICARCQAFRKNCRMARRRFRKQRKACSQCLRTITTKTAILLSAQNSGRYAVRTHCGCPQNVFKPPYVGPSGWIGVSSTKSM